MGRLKILLKASLDSGDSSGLLQSPDTLTTAHLTGGGAVNNIQHGSVVTADSEGVSQLVCCLAVWCCAADYQQDLSDSQCWRDFASLT